MSHHHHHPLPVGPNLTRRATLGGIGAALALSRIRPAYAGVAFAQRLVIINLRGGLDGLATVVPYGDPNLATLRAALTPPPVGQTGGMFDLGGFYGLNPAMPNMYAMFQANQMLAVHAVGNILNSRSHFADQTALQSGELAGTTSGWMNRLAGVLSFVAGGSEVGVVIGPGMPTIAQGPLQLASYAGSSLVATPNTLAALVETLGAPDPLIGAPVQSGFNDKALFQGWLSGQKYTGSPLVTALQQAGVFLNSPGGPALAVVETDSFDTHINQVTRLTTALADLDNAMAALKLGLGASWANTVVMTITEFGRTVAVNGCGGSDHGTGFAMFLAGGAVVGGRVIANWPGLGQRDLAGTTDVRSVIMGVLRDHLGLNATQLATVFPNAGAGVSPIGGLVNG